MTLGRDKLLSHFKDQILGPREGGEEALDDSPLDNYATGILFPQESSTNEVLESDSYGDSSSGSSEADEEGVVDDVLSMANQHQPASMGLSFFLSTDKKESASIKCTLSGARYQHEKKILESEMDGEGNPREVKVWQRKPFENIEILLSPKERQTICNELDVAVFSRWRPWHNGFVVTVAISNNSRGKAYDNVPACVFQPSITIQSDSGLFGDYPFIESLIADDDESELRLRYQHQKVYAVGHGCAADWELTNGHCASIFSTFIPSFDVLHLDTVREIDSDALKLANLRDGESEAVSQLLRKFVDGYANWLEEQREISPNTPEANRILTRIQTSIDRMKRGVDALGDPIVFEAFQLSQNVMIRQMEHSSTSLGGGLFSSSDAPRMPDSSLYTESESKWYPFQLAYQLLCLDSLVNPESEDRSIVDLIWASTGSGKTEAYLALAAMSIIYRRLTAGSRSGGTVVITRYTLRLLTVQQFERTARLACALESLRKEHPSSLGKEPVTIGLWIGRSQTPNTFSECIEWAQDIELNPSGQKGFQISGCPWCGARIVPVQDAPPRDNQFGFTAKNNSFKLHCPSIQCDFNEELPIQIVDEALYMNPPTILIGTVDKFARLTWEGRAGVFFGGEDNLPPSLIIQDELHLLEGPLGSTTGIYEAAFGLLCELKGQKPKILASTATIREADSQIRAIYGSSAHLFPSAGLDYSDSYFVKENPDRPGRTYVGVHCPSKTPSTSRIWVSSLLLQSQSQVEYDEPEETDGYWTLVAFHNTKYELGSSLTAGLDDIPARLQYLSPEPDSRRSLSPDDVMELSANIPSSQIPDALDRLSSPWYEKDSVAFVPCTKMFSVGVDIQRLGLMLVVGQPLQTSEYIQATSRVGRGKAPGLVVTLYSSGKPRDRAHYERFRSYHSALYRWVEPTSVTPFSLSSRKRSLAAVFVILMRHWAGYTRNEDARRFDPESEGVSRIIEGLYRRALQSDPSEAENVRLYLQKLAEDWGSLIREIPDLSFHDNNRGSNRTLLKAFGDSYGQWEAHHSMRNVDVQTPIDVIDWRLND